MLRSVVQYRVVVLGRPMGPWRMEREQACRDAIELDLGEYNRAGQFWITVPGDIEIRMVSVAEARAA